MTVSPVSFTLGPARHGWITLTVSAGEASDTIMCSDVFDPFPDLVDWAGRLSEGGNGKTDIDEEGVVTVIWLDRDPGSYAGRLRVFEKGPDGEPETVRIDAVVDVIQVVDAFHAAFVAYAASYEANHWNPDFVKEGPVPRTLAAIELRRIAWNLTAMGLAPPDPQEIRYAERVARCRAGYERQLGGAAVRARTVEANAAT
jgi:hypothetical protein